MITLGRFAVRLTDREVLRVIQENSTVRLTQEDIADLVGVHRITVVRSLKRLTHARLIVRHGNGRRGGYDYEVLS